MRDPLSEGYAFTLRDFWNPLRTDLDQDDSTLFSALPIDIQELQSNDDATHHLQDFRIPDLGDTEDRVATGGLATQSLPPVDDLSTPASIDTQVQDDVWLFDEDTIAPLPTPRLYTWESFSKKACAFAERTPYLSESRTSAFDAALTDIEKDVSRTGVLPQDVMLRALCNLAVGRASILFQWDTSKDGFVYTLPDIPLSGLSRAASLDVIGVCVDLGSNTRKLRVYAAANSQPTTCSALVAFKSSIASIVDSLERHILERTPRCRSLLQLQTLVEGPSRLLRVLSELGSRIDGCINNADLISTLSQRVKRIVSAESCVAGALQALLSRVSTPWLEEIRRDVGLNGSDSATDHAAEAGPNSMSVEVLSLITEEDQRMIEETKASVKAVRQYLPDSSLLTPATNSLNLQAIIECAPITSSEGRIAHDADELGDIMAWADDEVQQRLLASTEARIIQPLGSTTEEMDELDAAVAEAINAKREWRTTTVDSVEVDLLSTLRPLVLAQRARASRILLHHVFAKLDLLHHLDLQRQYHMLGNGDYTARLSKALFSPDTQSAERKRGMIPTAETMGLRLGARDGQRWPPASSELRLTLDGVLAETYHDSTGKRRRNSKDLPGNLSFSIRELPDAEIDRVMDPGSIYALDFLRLHYTVPPCLDMIVTPSALQGYDRVFRFLLRLLRVLHVVHTFKEQFVLHQKHQHGHTAAATQRLKFACQAYNVTYVLMSHVMDVGIAAPWRELMSSLGQVQKSLDAEEDSSALRNRSVGLVDLQELHQKCLDHILTRLCLRRRQEKTRAAIENVMTSILAAARVAPNEGAADCVRTFDQTVTDLISTLKGSIEKSAKSSANASDEDDHEAMRLLYRRLRRNDNADNSMYP